MKYRFLALIGLLALSAGAVMQAQDYDDIYYDASKSASATKATKQSKTVSAYGEVPERYKAVAQDNYRVERDVDEYNRRGNFEPNYQLNYEVDINGDTIYFDGDTIYEEAFANTRRIERFYNPDVVILSDDDDLVELYYDESPSINLVIGTDMGLAASYGWANTYYPWYTGWYPYYQPYYYSPWFSWYDSWSPYWYGSWYRPWHSDFLWGWSYMGYRPWWYGSPWAWDYGYGYHSPHTYHWTGYNPGHGNGTQRHFGTHDRNANSRVGLASSRNPNGRTDHRAGTTGRSRGVSTPTGTSRSGSSSVRGGLATGRAGNMGSGRVGSATTRPSSTGSGRIGGATTRPSGSVSRPASSGSRPSSGVSSRPSSSGSMGSRPSSSGSMGSRPSGGSSMGSGGGGSHGSSGGSSGGGTGRRH